MSWATVAACRLRGLFAHKRPEQELNEEVQFHLEIQIEDNLKAGMNPAEARYAAIRSFGALEHMRETYRERRTFSLIEATAKDLRYAARTLRKSPAFTLTAVAVLALAIGANTAMFSVMNAVLLRPLPYSSPDQLAFLWSDDPTQNLREGRSALWDVGQWQKQNQSFTDLATFDAVLTILAGSDGAEQLVGASISPNLLPLLGVQPVLGRGFSTEEAEQGQRVVLIGHSFWQARFAGSPNALSATLMLDGAPSRIIGILPPDFGIGRLNADVWKPHSTSPTTRGSETWSVVGRLRPGVTFERAQTEMSAIARRLNDQLPAAERNRGISIVPLNLQMVGPQTRLALSILGGAVFCVFLIAAANVTSLSLARSVARAREMTVRASLGASPGRIVRQLLTESILLAAVAGTIGAGLALAAIRLIRTFGPANLPRLNEATIDSRVLGWALAISVLSGIVVGLSPAIATLRRNLRPAGEEGGRSVSGGTSIRRVRRMLVVADFALAIVLLTGAGLLVRSWSNVTNIDPGFRSERVLTMQLSTPPALNMPAQRNDLYDRILEQVQALPGVESAGIADDFFSDNPREHVLTLDRTNRTIPERVRLTRDEVSSDFFKALGTPLLRGRFFSNQADRPGAPLAAIINEAMARRSWPEHDPVGRRFMVGLPNSGGAWFTVVGVVADMRRQGPEREPLPQIYVSLTQNPASESVNFFVRTSSDNPVSMAGALREAVRRVEKNAPITGLAPLEQQFGTYLAQRRFQTSLLTGFSIVALLMAAVGIYGLIHYSIATRTQEIGLRMAMGAQTGEIFRMILGEGLKLSLTGLTLGLLGALWLGQAGSSLLLGVAPTDPLTFSIVSLLVMAVSVAACCFPARRAMKIDPIVALRQD
jgi:predicted permease